MKERVAPVALWHGGIRYVFKSQAPLKVPLWLLVVFPPSITVKAQEPKK